MTWYHITTPDADRLHSETERTLFPGWIRECCLLWFLSTRFPFRSSFTASIRISLLFFFLCFVTFTAIQRTTMHSQHSLITGGGHD